MRHASKFSTRHLYLQVRDALAQEIATGKRKSGGLLPNEIDLSREFGVSIGTMRKALEVLAKEKLVTRQPGRGTLVCEPLSAEVSTRFDSLLSELGEPLTGENSYIDISESLPNAVEQQELRLRSNEAILVIKRTFDYRDRPVVYEEISLPTGRFPTFDFTSMAKSYRISTLADQCGIHLLGGKEKVDVGTADREVATRLGVEEGTPVLQICRVMFSSDEQPLERRVAHCRVEAVQYVARYT